MDFTFELDVCGDDLKKKASSEPISISSHNQKFAQVIVDPSYKLPPFGDSVTNKSDLTLSDDEDDDEDDNATSETNDHGGDNTGGGGDDTVNTGVSDTVNTDGVGDTVNTDGVGDNVNTDGGDDTVNTDGGGDTVNTDGVNDIAKDDNGVGSANNIKDAKVHSNPHDTDCQDDESNVCKSLEIEEGIFLHYFTHKTSDYERQLVDLWKSSEVPKEESGSNTAQLPPEELHTDLVPGVYEGGLKIWECCLDLVEYLALQELDMSEKSVLELGCGAGLPGIWALIKGASVDFQDFNKDVIHICTVPNVCLSSEDGDSVSPKARFFHGDWAAMNDYYNVNDNSKKFDFILTSETIYSPESYEVLHGVMENLLKPDGTIYVAAKSYYFGVGGSVSDFQDFVFAKGVFLCEEAVTVGKGIERVILKMNRLHKKKRKI